MYEIAEAVEGGDFIGVYPEGLEYSWNLGPEASEADDVAFTEAILSMLTGTAVTQRLKDSTTVAAPTQPLQTTCRLDSSQTVPDHGCSAGKQHKDERRLPSLCELMK